MRPLPFLIFINDLPNNIFPSCYLFANDLELYFQEKNLIYLSLTFRPFNFGAKAICYFSMPRNAQLYLFSSKKPKSFALDKNVLADVTLVKDLGLLLSNDLKRTCHLQAKNASGLKLIYLFKRNCSSHLCVQSKLNVYKSTIEPTILYVSPCWTALKSHMKMVESFNKKLIKLIKL